MKMNGDVSIIEVEGRYGPFKVAQVQSKLGLFELSSEELEDLSVGDFQGSFYAEKISMRSFVCRSGAVMTKLVIQASDIVLDAELEQEVATQVKQEKPKLRSKLRGLNTPKKQAQPESKLACFDEDVQKAIKAGGVVRLDPTVSRNSLRKQADMLKVLGYYYEVEQQAWYQKSESTEVA